MVDISIRARGLTRAIDDMRAAKRRAKDLTPVLEGRAEALRSDILTKSFAQSRDPSGAPWAPLAESTLERRRGGSAKTLVDTGQLRGSIVAKAGPKSIVVGVSGAAATYAGAHQMGTTKAGRGNRTTIPRRAFLPMNKAGRPDFGAGWAKAWRVRLDDRILTYITRGEI